MSDQVGELERKFNDLESKINLLVEQLDQKENQINRQLDKVEDFTKARWILVETQHKTQQYFKERVETLVTLAIKSVFKDREFGFELVFNEERKDRMEIQPVIYEMIDGVKEVYDEPEYDVGGGINDVISFAFRIALWSLENPRSRNVIILDEPMKNMGALISLGGKIFQEIAHRLGFQLIIITHDDELISIADRAYKIVHDRVESRAELVIGKTKGDGPWDEAATESGSETKKTKTAKKRKV